jgi:hypothetical protein
VSVTYLCSEQGIERGIEGALAGKRAVRAAALDMDSTVDTLEAQSFSVFLRQVRQAIEALASQGEDVDVEEEDGRPRPAEEAGGGAGEATSATAVASQAEGTALPGERAPEAVAAPDAGPGGLPDAAHAGTAHTDAEAAGTPHAAAGRAGTPHPAAEHGGAAPADAARRSAARTDASHPGAALADASRAQNRLRLARIVLESGFPDDAVRAAYEALAAAIRGLLGGAAPGGHAALVAAIYRDLSPRGLLPSAAHAALARLHDLSGLEAQGVEVDTALAAESVSEAEAWVVRLSGSLPARTQRSQLASQQDAEAAGR